MFARTKRLTLRPFWPEDAAALTAAIAHEAVAMRLARVPWPHAIDDAAAFLALPRGAHDARFCILAHEGAAPRLVGGVALERRGCGAHELGYWITPSAWGRGYATEAGRMVLAMADDALGVRRIEAFHHLDNHGSRRVLTKLGFREVRREQRYSLAHGGEVESAAMALDIDADRSTSAMPIAA